MMVVPYVSRIGSEQQFSSSRGSRSDRTRVGQQLSQKCAAVRLWQDGARRRSGSRRRDGRNGQDWLQVRTQGPTTAAAAAATPAACCFGSAGHAEQTSRTARARSGYRFGSVHAARPDRRLTGAEQSARLGQNGRRTAAGGGSGGCCGCGGRGRAGTAPRPAPLLPLLCSSKQFCNNTPPLLTDNSL